MKKDRALHKYLSTLGDYQNSILAHGNLNQTQIGAVIRKDKKNIYGYEFYKCVIDSNGDIDKACEAVFGDLKSPTFVKKAGTDFKKSRLENYLKQFIVERQDIAKKMDTDPSTLSRYVNGEREIFAYQIHFLAKAQKVSQSEVFEFLYGPNGVGRIT